MSSPSLGRGTLGNSAACTEQRPDLGAHRPLSPATCIDTQSENTQGATFRDTDLTAVLAGLPHIVHSIGSGEDSITSNSSEI